jgi:hypothetical protein
VQYLVITDIDQVFVSSVEALLTVDRSLVLGYFVADYLFPWMRFRAGLLLLHLARSAHEDVETAIGILRENLAMILTGDAFWYIDQASIAVLLQMLVLATGRSAAVANITKQYRKMSFQPAGDRFNAKRKLERLRERGLCNNDG